MTLDLDPTADATEASEQPLGTGGEADIEAIVSRAVAKVLDTSLDKRFQGFQSVIDRKFNPLATAVEQLKTAGLTPEEQEQLNQDEQAREIERLRTENAMLSLRKDNPEAVDFFMEAMSKESLEDQIAYIASRLGRETATAVQEALEEEGALDEAAVPVTDPNNPARKQKPLGANTAAGQQMSDAVADAILSTAPKGALAMLRRQKTS
jgi:hypothetical protein